MEPRAISSSSAPFLGPLPMFATANSTQCRACPLAAGRTHIVDGLGAYAPDLLLIGEAPGQDEDLGGVPFVGSSGKLLRATLLELGQPLDRCFFTNSVKCRPPGNRNPATEELDQCRDWLELEIRSMRPRALLVLGKIALASVQQLPPDVLAAQPLYTTFHPAYILRSRQHTEAWRDQLAAAIGTRRAHAPEPPQPYRDAEPWLVKPWVAVDTETDQTDEDDGGPSGDQQMVCFQVSDGTASRLYLPGDPMLEKLRERHVFVQGAKFDLPLLGIDPRNLDAWDDTQLMGYVLRDDQIGLKPQAHRLLNYTIPPIQTLIGAGKRRIPFSRALAEKPDEAGDYARRDAYATSLLAEILTHRLADEPVLERYYTDVEKPVLPLLLEMEHAGIEVDPDALRVLDAELADEIAALTTRLQGALGEFNLASTKLLAEALSRAGLLLDRTTPTGKVSVDEAALLRAVGVHDEDGLNPGDHRHQLIAAILEIRGKAKLRTTYVRNLLEARDGAGRVHARFNQTRVATNRLSSSEPNLQNIPVRGAIQKTMRRAFRARAGCVLVKADYSQAELRVYGHYTREPVLVDAYTHTDHTGDSCTRCDVHQQVALELGIARPRAKNVMFASLYGASSVKLAQTAGVPPDQTVSFLGRMRERVPSLLTWQDQVTHQIEQQGYVETLLGWRNYYPLLWSPVPKERRAARREAANFPIQGTVAGLVKHLMLMVDQSVVPDYDARLLLQVHDEVVYEVAQEDAPGFARDLESIGAIVGEVTCGLSIPLVLDVQIGANWGDMTTWKQWRP